MGNIETRDYYEDQTPADGLAFDIDYDAHYCRHFAQRPSQWTLELSEDYLRNSDNAVSVLVDGKMA